MKNTITVPIAIALGYTMDRNSLKILIEQPGNYEVVINAGTGSDLTDKLKATAALPSICIIDISIASQRGFYLLQELQSKWPDVKVIILSVYDNEDLMTRILKAGAASFLYKGHENMMLAEAMEQVLENGNYLTGTVSKMLMRQTRTNALTDREIDVLCLCAKDLGYKQMAQIMGISERTVGTHRDKLFEKLDIHTKSGLANYAIQSGLMNLMVENFTPPPPIASIR